MPRLPILPPAGWENFYVIVGSAGGALIGLQFVVVTLIAALRVRTTADSISAFGTPTVVLLTGALVVSAVMSVPWPSLSAASAALAACGVGGLAYGVLVIRRARRQTVYEPVLEDWLWYGVLPGSAYAALLVGAVLLRSGAPLAPFVVGGAALGLLLIGIHNSWDTVTHMVSTRPRRGTEHSEHPPAAE